MRPLKSNAEIHLELLKTAVFKEPTHFFCGECEKYIPSTMDWVCGHCDTTHREVRLHSFLYKCKKCKRKPDAVECPHCKTVWKFSKNGKVKHVARMASNATPPPLPSETEIDKKRRLRKEKNEEKEWEIEDAKLEAKLREAKEEGAPKSSKKLKDIREKIQSQLEGLFGTLKTTSELREKYRQELKHDPELLKQVLEILDNIDRDSTHLS